MCGIAGILHFDSSSHVDAARLRRMRDVLTHRGPDDEGLLIDGPVGLAHRRLSIIDVAAGHQPMCNEDGTVWVVYNGEIYNHAALRPALEASGHRYRTRSDTETILHLYEEKGERLVEDLHGMFAFAIWDRPRRRLLLARDRLGIKPLYFAITETELLFGSEIKAVLASGAIRPAFDADTLPEFLATGFLSGDATFFRSVRKLLPAHVAVWSEAEGLQQRRYWQLPAPRSGEVAPTDLDPSDMRGRLESAVRSHLMSDVPLGVFLSGGIDSSALAALVAREANAPIQTFSVGFDDREADELPYARLAAEHIGSQHRDVRVSPGEFFESLPTLLWHEDEPIAFPSSIPLYFVARLARDHVKVVLTGEGADELFLGYNRYRVTRWNARLGTPYWSLAPARVRSTVRDTLDALPPSIGRLARRSFLALEPGIRHLYLENFAVFNVPLQSRLLRDDGLLARHDPYTTTLPYYDDAPGDLVDRLTRGDLQTYLHELLMKQDQMSMAASIESRVPFLDDALVEHVASMPAGVKLPAWKTKILLRAAVRDLVPPAILTRRKLGFPVPLARWFGGAFRPVVDEFVLGPRAQARGVFDPEALRHLADEHASGRASHADRLWLLINLEIWNRIFCDGEDPADIARLMRARRPSTVYANPVGEDRRPLAAHERRPRPEPAHPVAALEAARRHADHDARPGR